MQVWRKWLSRLDLLLANQTQILPPGGILTFVSLLHIIDVQAVARGLLGSVMIDLDGGGPIPPARLVCRLEGETVVPAFFKNFFTPILTRFICTFFTHFLTGETVVTEVEHDLKEKTKVDGFQEPGSFSQQVTYHASEKVRLC